MPEAFDPYHKWLAIPPEEQPPNYYRLLSMKVFESDTNVIASAADKQMAHVRSFQTGQHSALSQQILNEISTARICLLNAAKKAAYDAVLRGQLAASEGARSRLAKAEPLEEPLAGLDLGDFTRRPAATAVVGEKSRPSDPRKLPWQLPAAIGAALLACVAIWAYMAATKDLSQQAMIQSKAAEPLPPKKVDAGTATKPETKKPPKTEEPKPEPSPEQPPKPSSTALATTVAPPAMPEQTQPETAPKTEPDTKAEPTSTTAITTPEKPKLLTPPSAAVQQEIASQVEEVYKLGDARKPPEQVKLAKDLADMAEKSAKPDEQFVLLRKAAELSCQAGDTTLMFQMVDRLGGQFELDVLSVKGKLLAKLAASANDAARIKSLVEGSSAIIDEALTNERFDLALELVDAVNRTCQKPRGAPFRKQVLALRKEIQEQQQQAERVGQALEAVQVNPQDAEANLTLGKLYCFSKGDWGKGLPYLAKGSDEDLKTLASQETGSPPSDAEEQVKLADAWWKVGQAAKGKERGAILLHAGTWYQQAQPGLPAGLVKAKVEKRLEEIAALGREIPTVSGRQPLLAVAPFNEKTAKRAPSAVVAAPPCPSGANQLDWDETGSYSAGRVPDGLAQGTDRGGGAGQMAARAGTGTGCRARGRSTACGSPSRSGWADAGDAGGVPACDGQQSEQAFQGDTKRPVEQVSWDDAVEFCRRLSELPGEKAAKRRYQLPTEAQWEYACRAGNPGRRYFSDQPKPSPGVVEEKLLRGYSWFGGNAGGQTHPVGQKLPNAWGLYDMHGNVWEWCADWYDGGYYAGSPTDDPAGPTTGSSRVRRGGHWNDGAESCRSANRSDSAPGQRGNYQGFRVSLVPAEAVAETPIPKSIAPFNEKTAKQHQARWAKHLGVPVVQTNSIGMKLALIPPGKFDMGSPKELIEEEMRLHRDDSWYVDRLPGEGPQHRVRITKPYWLGVTQVTQEEYQRVMGSNPSKFQGDPKRPVEQVSWDDAVEFCRRLSELPGEKAAKRRYHLPTEAQWEYACRAGNPVGGTSAISRILPGGSGREVTGRVRLVRRQLGRSDAPCGAEASLTLGACTTCTGTCGSGVRTGMMLIITRSRPRMIRRALRRARVAWSVVAAGASSPGPAARRPAMAAGPGGADYDLGFRVAAVVRRELNSD